MKQEKLYKKLSKLVNGLKPKQGLEKDIFEIYYDYEASFLKMNFNIRNYQKKKTFFPQK